MSEMDEPNFFLEDLDDEGEEVDYEDFDLEDIESGGFSLVGEAWRSCNMSHRSSILILWCVMCRRRS